MDLGKPGSKSDEPTTWQQTQPGVSLLSTIASIFMISANQDVTQRSRSGAADFEEAQILTLFFILTSPHLLSITQYGPSHCHPKLLSNNFSPPAGSTVREWARSDLAGSSANIPSESDRFRWIQIFGRIKPNQLAWHKFNWNCSQWPLMLWTTQICWCSATNVGCQCEIDAKVKI